MRTTGITSINYKQQTIKQSPSFGALRINFSENLEFVDKFIEFGNSIKTKKQIARGVDNELDQLVGIIKTKKDSLLEKLVNEKFFNNKAVSITEEEAKKLIENAYTINKAN